VSIGDAVKGHRYQGYTCAWITWPVPWEDATRAMVSELHAALKEYDVDMWEVGAYRNILHPDDSVRQTNLKWVAHCIEIAEKIGCRMASTITGSHNSIGSQWIDNYAVHPDNWTLETWKLTLSGINQILKDTAGLKAVLGMEASAPPTSMAPLPTAISWTTWATRAAR